MYFKFQKYHFNFQELGIIGKLVKSSELDIAEIDLMYLLLYWVTYTMNMMKI